MTETPSSSQFLQSLSDATTALVDRTAPSVVSVGSGHCRGTGVVWNAEGYIVTASHVVGRRTTVAVGLGNRQQTSATVVGHDPYSDLALLKVEPSEFHPIEQGDANSVKVGQFVLALANPFNQQTGATSGMVTSMGNVFHTGRGPPIENIIVTDARLSPGYSGGPLVDAAGKMIGLNVAVVWSRSIALPVSRIQHVVDQLISQGSIRRAYLGITFQTVPLPPELSQHKNVNQEAGAIILSIEADSAAQKAGLSFGDVLIRFDDNSIQSAHDLPRVLTDQYIGKPTKLTVLRSGKVKDLTITPTARDTPN